MMGPLVILLLQVCRISWCVLADPGKQRRSDSPGRLNLTRWISTAFLPLATPLAVVSALNVRGAGRNIERPLGQRLELMFVAECLKVMIAARRGA